MFHRHHKENMFEKFFFPSPTLQICSASSRICSTLLNSSTIHEIPTMKCGSYPISYLSSSFHTIQEFKIPSPDNQTLLVISDNHDLLLGQLNYSLKGLLTSTQHTTFRTISTNWTLVVLHPCPQDKLQPPWFPGPPKAGLYINLQPHSNIINL